ncbi:hypothetical protein GY21_01535 [Cryobacterium roopkundense]|uniref:Uncharacterized protein n=1 Tax=Cryobacterium roopkundense TaxID=1001240 RepID=A0A099JVS7_9MICO|nr:hypothetical protein [Cryobacterium roopkundense]KGJ81782.1 hypothetical protein GY21_01535 [Cryobacterium roopkundense]MBB5642404.1 hypothetical protein [Cryobacterium roopkundense]
MARRPIRHVPKDSSRRRVWVYAAVAAFIIFDLALIGFALSTTKADADVTPGTVPTSSEASTPSAEPVASTSPAAPTASTVVAVTPSRMISAVDGTTAWRAVSGECPTASVSPEVSSDSGATWTSTDASGPTDVSAVQSIAAQSGSVVEFVGLDQANCAPLFVKTFVGGDNFRSYPEQLDGQWYVDPADRAVVHSPAGDSAAPCASVLALAPRSGTEAAVLCSSNELYVTADAAATWSAAAVLAGAVNVAASDAGYVAAVAGAADCAGVQVVTLTPELAPTVTGCLPVAGDLPGNVTLSATGDTLWLWANDTLARSTTAGAAWL